MYALHDRTPKRPSFGATRLRWAVFLIPTKCPASGETYWLTRKKTVEQFDGMKWSLVEIDPDMERIYASFRVIPVAKACELADAAGGDDACMEGSDHIATAVPWSEQVRVDPPRKPHVTDALNEVLRRRVSQFNEKEKP